MKKFLIKLKNQDYFFAMMVTVAFLAVLMIFSPYFFSETNLSSLQASIAPRAILALGMMLLVIMGMFDLSVGSIMGFAGILCGFLLSRAVPVGVSILLALLVGALIGAINGVLVAYANIQALITTIGTMFIFRGFCEMIMTSELASTLTGFPQSFLDFGSKTFLGLYYMMWILLALVILIQIVIKKTYFGRKIYFIGGNMESAVSLGINAKLIVFLCFVASGVLSALAGVVSVARFQSASRYLGKDIQIDILIACVVGGGSLLGGKGDMVGAVFGTMFMALLENAFNLFEINTLLKSVVVGLILVVVVVIDGYISLKKQHALGRT